MGRGPRRVRITALAALLTLACGPQGERSGAEERLDRLARQNNLGTAWLGQQSWAEAEAALTEGLEIDPSDPVLLVNLALARMRQGRSQEAEVLLRRALAERPDDPHAHFILGLVAKRDGRFEEAVREFEAVRRADPDDVATLHNLGGAHAALGDGAQAEEFFRAVLERNPVHVPATYGLGRLLLSRGDGNEGRRLIALSQEIRARDGIADSAGTGYGDQGFYALGIDYPADRFPPPPQVGLAFERPGEAAVSQADDGSRPPPWAAALLAPDSRESLIVATAGGVAAIQDGARATLAAAPPDGAVRALAAGDLDADGTIEIAALVAVGGGGGHRLELRHIDRVSEGGWSWSDDAESRAERTIALDGVPDGVALTLVDRDHDGDLDPFACWTGARSV
ncbi:MAG: tetratricopeptide repeat protein, partial [Acidobacteriota bacterium]|nr:tetratricopeptide repeat protein [Acidobacteriota bacterium]